jgi:hypothetical protein
MYGKIDIEKNIFPMLSFSPESMGTMFIQDYQGLLAYANGPNSDTEKDTEPTISSSTDIDSKNAPGITAKTTVNAPTKEGAPANVKDSDGNPITVKTTVKVDSKSGEAGRIFSLPLDGSETQQFIKDTLTSVRENNADEQGIRVNWGSIGLPNFVPGMYATLLGVGDFFDGNYYADDITYNINSSGVEMACVGQGRGFPAINVDLDPFGAELELKMELNKARSISDKWVKGLPPK